MAIMRVIKIFTENQLRDFEKMYAVGKGIELFSAVLEFNLYFVYYETAMFLYLLYGSTERKS